MSNKQHPAQDEREAFEAWMREEYAADEDMLKKPHEGRYFYAKPANMWSAWQARATRPAQAEPQPVRLPQRKNLDGLLDPASKRAGMAYNEALEDVELLNTPPIAQTAPQHPDDAAVDRFAAAMKAKLAKSRAKGRGGWDDPNVCSVEFLAQLLVEHLGKGNAGTFEDVANFAMMLHQRGADPMVLAEAAEAPIKKARGEALELGVRALESKSEHTEPPPAQDEREAVERFSPTTSVPHCGRASEVEAYMTEDDDGEYMTVSQHERIVAALTRPAQAAPLKPHQLRELVNDLRDVARKYHATEQLREQIAYTLRTALSAQGGETK